MPATIAAVTARVQHFLVGFIANLSADTTVGWLVCLVAASIFADFLLQTARVAHAKRDLRVTAGHGALVALLGYALCGVWYAWLPAIAVLVAHTLIDFAKTKWGGNAPLPFLIDQLAHFASILLIAGLIAPYDDAVGWLDLLGPAYLVALVVLSGFVIATRACGMVIGLSLEPFQEQLGDKDGFLERGLENGGATIGVLERALIFLFVFGGQPGAIGFLIAAKSIFRFGELTDNSNRKEAEYIIIGTLLSFACALVVAFATQIVLRLL